METNTSTEYWQKGASLLVTDPLGTRDVQLPPNARSYLIAGTQHNAAAWNTSTRGSCVNPRNPHAVTSLHRALLVALDEWVEGKAPPDSRTPRIKDHTLVNARELQFPLIPGMVVASRINEIGVLKDWVKPEMDMSKPYRPLVPAVNEDGNETSGVILPDIAVPLATHTGWNLVQDAVSPKARCAIATEATRLSHRPGLRAKRAPIRGRRSKNATAVTQATCGVSRTRCSASSLTACCSPRMRSATWPKRAAQKQRGFFRDEARLLHDAHTSVRA